MLSKERDSVITEVVEKIKKLEREAYSSDQDLFEWIIAEINKMKFTE